MASVEVNIPQEYIFEADFDDEGVYFYQAYNHNIANWAIDHQKLGGPEFNPTRMTWIKPSLAWVLYRSGYARKRNQERILKVKLSHQIVADIISQCKCCNGGGGSLGRIQWDPARDIMSKENKKDEPRKMLRKRAIQIGIKGKLSQHFVDKILSIQDVTELAHKIGQAHSEKSVEDAMSELIPDLPLERCYTPKCSDDILTSLKLLPNK